MAAPQPPPPLGGPTPAPGYVEWKERVDAALKGALTLRDLWGEMLVAGVPRERSGWGGGGA